MYYPVQIPYILNKAYSQNMKYTEEPAPECGGFVICFWNMQPLSERKLSVKNIIAADGCIDLVVGFDERRIGFSGMSRTEFDYIVELPARFMGARMMPGAFYQLTGLPASAAMDNFMPIEEVFPDFDKQEFFALDFEEARYYFKEFFRIKTHGKTADEYTLLFHTLSQNAPGTTEELYQSLHFSPRQCQRNFAKYYGITPKMVLSIVRFQKCLEILTSPEAKPVDILNVTGYYDQPHFIKDFKRNMGITPLELVRIYRD